MANNTVNNNPWKGLNFYVEGEVLYGRNSEIESLSQYIVNNTQTVLYGKSGIGKSSILNAGVFPVARQLGLLPVGIRLDHNSTVSYIKQIQAAILRSGADVHEIVPVIDEETETLWEYLHRNIFFDSNGKRMQLLLVLDQFEEIFTLQQNEKKKRVFFEELADLLNDVTPLYIVNADKKLEPVEGNDVQEVTDNLDEMDIEINLDDVKTESSSRYLQKVDYHIVFTLREDFLSYLERYTAYIPVMKSNRYGLLPLNEEQAADIIMKPREGLVSKDVARLIIQKITGNTDFHVDGIPEIDVDAAVLSLYLSRLYIKKGKDQSSITADLVREFSDDIIKDFYEESVTDIPSDTIEKIEDQLLTYEGRRNNVSRNDLIREGVPEKIIRTLVEDRKLLRQFSYQDDIRVEFMHDILCPVVNARIEQREAARLQAEKQKIIEQQEREKQELIKKQEEEIARIESQTKALRSKRRFRMTLILTLAGIIISGLLVLVSQLKTQARIEQENAENLRKRLEKFNVNLSLAEEVAVRGLWWEANLKASAKAGTKDTIIINRSVDKTFVDSTFNILVDSLKWQDMQIMLTFKGLKNFDNVNISLSIDSLVQNPIVQVPIKLKDPIRYGGRLVLNDSITKKEYDIKNAIVILNNEVVFSDAKGMFQFQLQDSVTSTDELTIIKKGYGISYVKPRDLIIDSSNPIFKKVEMTLKDSLDYLSIKDYCEGIGDLGDLKWNFYKKNPIRYINIKDGKAEDNIIFYIKEEENNYIWGVYSYGKDYMEKKYAYHFFEGKMDDSVLDTIDKQYYRTFEITSKDIANNEETIKGKRSTKKGGEWEFKIFMHSKQIAESISNSK